MNEFNAGKKANEETVRNERDLKVRLESCLQENNSLLMKIAKKEEENRMLHSTLGRIRQDIDKSSVLN